MSISSEPTQQGYESTCRLIEEQKIIVKSIENLFSKKVIASEDSENETILFLKEQLDNANRDLQGLMDIKEGIENTYGNLIDNPDLDKLKVYCKAVLYINADTERRIATRNPTPSDLMGASMAEGYLKDEIKRLKDVYN